MFPNSLVLKKKENSMKYFSNFTIVFTDLLFMRHTIIYILSLLFLVATRGFAAGAAFGTQELKKYNGMPTERLLNLGKHYLDVRHKPDSALVCYTIIASRYKNKAGSKAEMRCYALALNNLGYLYGGYYLDFEHAYDYLSQAVAVSKKYRIDDNLAYAYVNLAGIYSSRSELLGIGDSENQIQKYCRLAFDEAVRQKQWDVASASFLNLFTSFSEAGSAGKIKDDLRRFLSIPALRHDPLSKFVYDDYRGTLAYNRGAYREALATFRQQLRDAEAVKSVTMNCRVLALWNIYEVYHKTKHWDEAMHILDRLEEYASQYADAATHNKVLQHKSDLYRERGETALATHYDYLYLKSKDSLLTRSNADRMERSVFVHELSRVNTQLAESNARHHQMVMAVLVLLAFIIVIAVALVVNIRGLRKQKAYVRKLYEKNVELLEHKSAIATAAQSGLNRAAGLSEDLKSSLLEHIDQTINNPEIFCAQDFSLHQLATLVESNDKYVSHVINERYHKNFKQLLNEARVAEACRRLGDQEHYGHLTIAAIAKDVGFGSRSNFALAFKRVTGISPSDYLRQAHHKG